MSGYYQVKMDRLREELQILDLDDLEYVSEENELTTPETQLPYEPNQYVAFCECPRCQSVQRNVLREPYCTDCGWDSVTDPCLEVLREASV